MNEKDYLRGGRIEPGRSYVRLFRNQKTVSQAIRYLNQGYTFTSIARKLGCDRSTIDAFKKRKEKDGVVFKVFAARTRSFRFPKRDEEPVVPDAFKEPFPVNRGKETYAEYVMGLKKRLRDVRVKQQRDAKRTIDKLRKWRKKNGIVTRPRAGSDWDNSRIMPDEILPDDSPVDVVENIQVHIDDEY